MHPGGLRGEQEEEDKVRATSSRSAIPMKHTSSLDRQFRDTISQWIGESSEVLALFRYSHAAGSRDFVFFTGADDFREKLEKLPSRTSVIVFREPQLPLRGVVNEELTETAMRLIPEDQEYLILCLEYTQYGKRGWFHWDAGDTHEDLMSDLRYVAGRLVAVGLYPPWLEDNENVISAIVPDTNGVVQVGVY